MHAPITPDNLHNPVEWTYFSRREAQRNGSLGQVTETPRLLTPADHQIDLLFVSKQKKESAHQQGGYLVGLYLFCGIYVVLDIEGSHKQFVLREPVLIETD